ncbi:MAG TPA: PLP-dependent aminotransferase family protein [Acidimicrobiia bacterium]
MDVHIPDPAPGDRIGGIYRGIVDAILSGRLRPGDRLPPSRRLAEELGVARVTVTTAYERLVAEGYLEGRVGVGTFVSTTIPDVSPSRAPSGSAHHVRPVWRKALFSSPSAPPRHDFRLGMGDPGFFPRHEWRRAMTTQLAVHDFSRSYPDPSGRPSLRAAIARHIAVSRAVRCGPEDVLVTRGAQQAFDVIARTVIEPGAVIAVEDPGYPPVRKLLQSLGAVVVPVEVDPEGIVVEALPPEARLVYVTPSHQFPLGTTMSLRRRLELLAWSEQHDALVIEDDYDSEFRFTDRPLDPLQSLDSTGRVIYVGSFSKTMHPSLRLGFVVAPEALRRGLAAARLVSDWHGDPILEEAMAAFIERGDLARHLRRTRQRYRRRHDALLAALDEHLGRWLEPFPSGAGLHVAARLRPDVGIDVDAVVALAAERGVAVNSLSEMAARSSGPDGLAFGYGLVSDGEIQDGLLLLAECFDAASHLVP